MVNLFSFTEDYLIDRKTKYASMYVFLNLVMEEEALLQAGTQRYERTDSRKATRNGYKSRTHMDNKYDEKNKQRTKEKNQGS